MVQNVLYHGKIAKFCVKSRGIGKIFVLFIFENEVV